MSQKPTPGPPAKSPPPEPVLRATVVDYFLLLLGVALSVFLTHLVPPPFEARDGSADTLLKISINDLSTLMRLPEGVLLLGPLFLLLQWARGRKQGLTSIEWLWVLSWIGLAIVSGLATWRIYLPGLAPAALGLAPRLWYLILVPSMAVLGVVLRLVGLFGRRPAPWTHALGLALLVWPLLPLAGVLTLGTF